jgi:hypothetical protein
MKKIILIILVAIAFAACQKNGTNSPKPVTPTKDTIPDGASLRMQLVKDSSKYYEILVHFNHTFHLVRNYNNDEDAIVPGGDPNLDLSAISSDGYLLSVDGVPYTPGLSIPLKGSAANGPYFLRASHLVNMPSSIHIWCKDNYLKDSLDLRTGNYHFNVDNADTNSFGKNRFRIVLR